MTLSTDTARFEGLSSLFYERHTSFYEKNDVLLYNHPFQKKFNRISDKKRSWDSCTSMRGIGYTLPLVLLEEYQKLVGSNMDQTNRNSAALEHF